MALLRSQSGPYAGMALSVAPASFLTRIDSALFSRSPPPASPRSRSVCADVAVPWIPLATIVQRVREPGVLGRRGFAVESAAARVCRDAGG